MATISPFGLAPEEALRWFRTKGLAPRFDWRDLYAAEHAKAFTVAKATQLDVLADLYQGVSDAIEKGQSLGEFKKGLRPLLQQKGWWGEKEVADPTTGELRTVQLGSARRLQIIYDTNLRTAHAAAQWDRIKTTAQTRPWLRYVAIEKDGRTRKAHLSWHGTILPWDHPWWKTHYPPNGWGCRCKVIQLSDRDLNRYGLTPSKDAPITRNRVWFDARNQVERKVPIGIDPGFEYNVGEGRSDGWPAAGERAYDPPCTYRTYQRPPAARIAPQPAVERWATPRHAKDLVSLKEQWVAHFGSETANVKDPTGDSVQFNQAYLEHLLDKFDAGDAKRATLVPTAHETVKNPLEIWLVPTRVKSGPRAAQVVFRKRYIQLFEGGSQPGYVVVVDRTPDGQVAWTSYAAKDIDKLREGYLVFPK